MAKIFKKALIPLALWFLAFQSAEAAFLYFSPQTGNYAQGENFNVTIFVSANRPVNAVSGVLNFPTQYLEVVALSTASSVVNLWVHNPSFSNAGNAGNVRFEGVILNPGFTGPSGRVVDAVFRVKKTGAAGLTFGESTVLANDGLGTNITTPPSSALYALVESQAPTRETARPDLERRIEKVEEKIGEITESPPPAPLIVVQAQDGIVRLWEIVPGWMRLGVLALLGAIVAVLALVIISFGLVVLIWLWSYGVHRRERFVRRAWLMPEAVRRALRRGFALLGFVEHEIESDVRYGLHQLEEDFEEAREGLSLRKVMKDYWGSLGKVVKRFATRNDRRRRSEEER